MKTFQNSIKATIEKGIQNIGSISLKIFRQLKKNHIRETISIFGVLTRKIIHKITKVHTKVMIYFIGPIYKTNILLCILQVMMVVMPIFIQFVCCFVRIIRILHNSFLECTMYLMHLNLTLYQVLIPR